MLSEELRELSDGSNVDSDLEDEMSEGTEEIFS